MKLAVFGSTGVVGSAVTDLALERGHKIRTLVRGNRATPGVEVVRGNALDPDAVATSRLCAMPASTASFRIPLVVPGPASGRVRVGRFKLGPRSSVQVGDVATEMLDALDDRASVHTAPMIYTAQSS